MARGQTVEIVRASEQHVYYRNYGRHADGAHRYKLLHAAFRVSYEPLRLTRTPRPNGVTILTPSPPSDPPEEHAVPTFALSAIDTAPPIIVSSYEGPAPYMSLPEPSLQSDR